MVKHRSGGSVPGGLGKAVVMSLQMGVLYGVKRVAVIGSMVVPMSGTATSITCRRPGPRPSSVQGPRLGGTSNAAVSGGRRSAIAKADPKAAAAHLGPISSESRLESVIVRDGTRAGVQPLRRRDGHRPQQQQQQRGAAQQRADDDEDLKITRTLP